MLLPLLLTAVFHFINAAHATNQACPALVIPVRNTVLVEDNQIIMCSAEKWPGLLTTEFYVTIVSHDAETEDPLAFDSKIVVFNTKTGEQTPAPKPNDYFYLAKSKKYSAMLSHLIKASLASQISPPKQKFEVQIKCKDDPPTPRLSLVKNDNRFEWQIEFEKSARCEVIQIGENPRYVASDIVVHPSKLKFDSKTGELDIKNLNVEILPRQSFHEFSSNNSGERDYLGDFVNSTSGCENFQPLRLTVSNSPIFDQNKWQYDDHKSMHALSLNLSDQINEAFVSTPTVSAAKAESNHKLPVQIILEEKNTLDQTRRIGAWQVSSPFEIRNLIYYQNNDNPKRVIFRDPKCGKEFSSNWVTDEKVK